MHSMGEYLEVMRKSYITWGICEYIEQVHFGLKETGI